MELSHPKLRSRTLIQVIYASAATEPFTTEALKALLAKARARNTLHGVTGMLVHHDGSFLQILEGPEAAVDQILEAIYRDPRHQRARELYRGAIKTREFDTWSMGFVDNSFHAGSVVGFIDYSRGLTSAHDDGARAHSFLRFFREGLYRQHAG